MDAAVAETVARSTREQAADDACADLKQLRRQAVEAGREQSRKIIKTSRIDPRTGEIRYNPAGRLLRDWYLHVYINQLRTRLGEPAIAIDAQQVEDTTAILRRLRPDAHGRYALQAVGVIRDTAIADAATAAANTVDKLHDVAQRRALRHAPDVRFDGEALRIHVTRHWYVRSYQDQVERSTGSQLPLGNVTNAETAQVALVLQTGIPIRLIGHDGIPLITAHATVMTDVDRQLASGGTHLAPSLTSNISHTDVSESLGSRLPREWDHLDESARKHWLDRAGAPSQHHAPSAWTELAAEVQTKVILMYLRAGGPKQNHPPFVGTVIDEQPEFAAQLMFAHQAPLVTGDSAERHVDEARSERAQSVEQSTSIPLRSQGISG